MEKITSLAELCGHFEADGLRDLNHSICNDTECGASISIHLGKITPVIDHCTMTFIGNDKHIVLHGFTRNGVAPEQGVNFLDAVGKDLAQFFDLAHHARKGLLVMCNTFDDVKYRFSIYKERLQEIADNAEELGSSHHGEKVLIKECKIGGGDSIFFQPITISFEHHWTKDESWWIQNGDQTSYYCPVCDLPINDYNKYSNEHPDIECPTCHTVVSWNPDVVPVGHMCEDCGKYYPTAYGDNKYMNGTSPFCEDCGGVVISRLDNRNRYDSWDIQLSNPNLPPFIGFTIQTIVEGSDTEVNSDEFSVPTDCEYVENWMKEMEAQATYYWDRDNLSHYKIKSPDGEGYYIDYSGDVFRISPEGLNPRVKSRLKKWLRIHDDGGEYEDAKFGVKGWLVSTYTMDGSYF